MSKPARSVPFIQRNDLWTMNTDAVGRDFGEPLLKDRGSVSRSIMLAKDASWYQTPQQLAKSLRVTDPRSVPFLSWVLRII